MPPKFGSFVALFVNAKDIPTINYILKHEERYFMNTDTVQGNWTELKGKIKAKWAKFTDNDIEAFKGNLEQIAGKVQQIYGYAKEKAEQEYQDFKKSLTTTKH